MGVAPQDILWNDAYLSVGVPDLRGIRSSVGIDWEGRTLQFQPGGGEDGLWSSGLRVPIPGLEAGKETDFFGFAFDLGINGSKALQFLPLGQQTMVDLHSTWPSPSFSGAFLPESRKVTGAGVRRPLEHLLVRPQLPSAVAAGGGREAGSPGRAGRVRLRRRALPAGGRLSEDGAVGEVRRALSGADLPHLFPVRGVQRGVAPSAAVLPGRLGALPLLPAVALDLRACPVRILLS